MYWQVKELSQSLTLPLFSLSPSRILSSPARLHCQICFTTLYKRWKNVINFLYYLWIKVPVYITAVGMYIYFIPLTLRTFNPYISIHDIPLPLNSMGTLRQDRVSCGIQCGKIFPVLHHQLSSFMGTSKPHTKQLRQRAQSLHWRSVLTLCTGQCLYSVCWPSGQAPPLPLGEEQFQRT